MVIMAEQPSVAYRRREQSHADTLDVVIEPEGEQRSQEAPSGSRPGADFDEKQF